MQMLGLVQEGFDEQQVGSSAMAHKRNPILCERVGGLQNVVRGYHLMLELTAGNTWFEGDVSDSSTRRVAWPGIFLATSGLLRTFHDLLSGLKHRKLAVDDELTEHETSLATGTVLSRAILAGVDRVRAHEALRQPYDKWAVALDMPADQVSDWVGGAGSGIAPEQARSVEGVT
jgi:adenylosuccinate lyase